MDTTQAAEALAGLSQLAAVTDLIFGASLVLLSALGMVIALLWRVQ